jgi:hypothetical protein
MEYEQGSNGIESQASRKIYSSASEQHRRSRMIEYQECILPVRTYGLYFTL